MTDIAAFLQDECQPILESADAALARMQVRHYETAGADAVQDHLVERIARRDLTPTVACARRGAEERFNAGYDLTEVQTAALTAAAPTRAARVQPRVL